MDVASLYTNIDHDEEATTCFERLEKRINKKVRSSTIKKLIKLVLSTNVFRFDNQLNKQIKGAAMGTPMAVNCANLFLDKFDNEMLDEYKKATNIRPMMWMRYIGDIFLIWQHDEKS